jgi:hypothetical protein
MFCKFIPKLTRLSLTAPFTELDRQKKGEFEEKNLQKFVLIIKPGGKGSFNPASA